MSPLVLCSALLLAVNLGVESQAVELTTDTGTLHGVLDLPPGDGPFPVVLIHPGSGPTDCDGNQPRMKNDSLKMLGHALAERGIACLRIDKRGIAASAKAGLREEDLRIETYAADAAAWVKQLRADERFGKVGFVGHSEGALIGEIAGQTVEFDAFVSLCGMGRRAADSLRGQLKGRFPPALGEHANAIIATLEAGKTTGDVHPILASLFRESVQPFLISLFRYDPAELIAKLDCPILIVTGTRDLQIPPTDGDRLAAAARGVRNVTLENMSHVLKETELTTVAEQYRAVYADPAPPLHPKLVDELAAFLANAFKTE